MEEEKKESTVKDETKTLKICGRHINKNGILSIIGAILHRLGNMSMMVYLGFSTYMISYLRYYQDEDETPLTLNYTYFIMPILTITIGIGIPFSGILEFKMGTKLLIVYSSLFLLLSSIIQYFSKVFFLHFFAIFLFAIGFSLSIAVSGKNACMYFPTRRGLITGLLSFIQAIFNSLLNILGEKVIINPESIDPVDGFYTYDTAKNITNFYIFQIICVTICTTLSVLFIVTYKIKNKKGPRKNQKKNKDTEKDENTDTKEPLMPPDENENENEEEKDNDKKENNVKNDDIIKVNEKESTVNYSMNQIKHAAKTFRVWRLFLMGVFSAPLNNFITIAWRPISINKQMPTYIIQNVNSYTSITQMIVTPLFGYLADKIPFRILKMILGAINCIIGFLFYFSFENVYFFVALLIINNFANSGMFALNEPHFMKVFGMKHVIEISGIIGLAGVIMGPICSIFAFSIEQAFNDNRDAVYKYMFMVSSLLYIVDIVLSFFETEDPLFE